MKEILFLSGKGGTGKTSVVSSLVHLAGNCAVCDYDVDASNLPLLLDPHSITPHEFFSGEVALVDELQCVACGVCGDYCRFGAINNGVVDALQCEGCGFCTLVCPVNAINLAPGSGGTWHEARTGSGQPFYYAELRPSQSNSGKLVSQIKMMAWEQAGQERVSLILSDGPPGLGCPVIAALNRVSLVVLVAEPSNSGFSDLRRLWELLRSRRIPAVLVVNKYDINPRLSKSITTWAASQGINCLGKIPYLEEMATAICLGQIPATFDGVHQVMEPIWKGLRKAIADLP